MLKEVHQPLNIVPHEYPAVMERQSLRLVNQITVAPLYSRHKLQEFPPADNMQTTVDLCMYEVSRYDSGMTKHPTCNIQAPHTPHAYANLIVVSALSARGSSYIL